MSPELRDCAWCGMPVELQRIWTRVTRRLDVHTHEVDTAEIQMVTLSCLSGHWYGGPLADVTTPPAG